MSKLLVVSPNTLHNDDLRIVERAIEHVESYAGRWRTIEIEPARDSLLRMRDDRQSDHVLLLGTQLSALLPPPRDTNLDAVHRHGILRYRGDQRWISTPHPRSYTPPPEDTKRKSPVVAANLIGHLVRHLELLKWGHVGWRDPTMPVRTRVVHDARTLAEFEHVVSTARELAIDTETKSLQRIGGELLTIQMGADGHSGWVLPVAHAGSPLHPALLRRARCFLKNYFEHARPIVHIYANAVFDLHQLYDWLQLRWYAHHVWDVQYGEFGLDENRESRKSLGFRDDGDLWGLERICQEHGMFHYSRSPVRKDQRDRLASLPFRSVCIYGALDAALPLRVMHMERAIAHMRDRGMAHRPYRRYVRGTLLVEGRKVLQIAHMERNGLLVDQQYTASLAHPDSDFQKEVRTAEAQWANLPDVVEANRRVIAKSHIGSGSLWNSGKQRVAFDVGKPDHRQILFVDVCGIEPQKYGKNGLASFDKAFKQKNRFVPIVRAYADLEEARTMYGTFVVGYHEILTRSKDCRDGRLRCSYDGKATTSRLKSRIPNLQNMPVRKERGKIIKRQFVSKRGRLYRKRDASAHEVRILGITAKDPLLADRFWTGMRVRLEYAMLWTVPADKAEWWRAQLTAADVHYQNYAMMHGVDPLTVTRDQRNSIKVPMFAATYGKSMPVLGEELKAEALTKVEDREHAVNALRRIAEGHDVDLVLALGPKLAKSARALVEKHGDALVDYVRAESRSISEEIDRIEGQDWTRYAEGLYRQIFEEKFRVSGTWLVDTQKMGQRTTHACNILGGVRHLPGYLHPSRSVQRACDRRGPNSGIQGPASNLILEAGYLLREMVWKWFVRRGISIDNVQCNAVHDCVTGDTLVPTSRGLLRMDEMGDTEGGKYQNVNYVVASRFGRERVGRWINKGIRPVNEIVTRMGLRVRGTRNHRMLVLRSGVHTWVRIGDVRAGDKLCVNLQSLTHNKRLRLNLTDYVPPVWVPNQCTRARPRTQKWIDAWQKKFTRPIHMTPDLAFVLGMINAEGMVRDRTFSVSNNDRALIDRFCACFERVFGTAPRVGINKAATKRRGKNHYVAFLHGKQMCHWLKELGIYGENMSDEKCASWYKVVPWSILQADRTSQLAYLAAYIEGDGSIGKFGIVMGSTSFELVRTTQLLILHLGYFCRSRFASTNRRVDGTTTAPGGVILESHAASGLIEELRPYLVSKYHPIVPSRSGKHYGLPSDHWIDLVKSRFVRNSKQGGVYRNDAGKNITLPLFNENPLGVNNWTKRKTFRYREFSEGGYHNFMAALHAISLKEYANLAVLMKMNYAYTDVVTNEPAGEERVYDLTVIDGEPAYVSNGLVCHNSAESESAIVQIPLLNYLEGHAFSTCLHRFARDEMGFAFNVGIESDPEVGACLSTLKSAARWDDEVEAIREGIRWGNGELGWELPEERLMRAVEHNAKIVHGIRRREIAHQLAHNIKTTYHMEMTEANARDYGLVFDVDIGPDPAKKRRIARAGVARSDEATIDWRKELT